ncbi:MAG: hypothetical protein WDZ51_09965 [Pirellulaceae bacterium]
MHHSAENPSNNVTPLPSNEAGHLVLPFGHDEFSEFIRSLLGRPQAIARNVPGPFEIEIRDVRNLHHLIDQRVAQQNECTLVEFHATIAFDDGSAVEFQSMDDLLNYNEVRSVVSYGLHVEWVYLVRFQDRQLPERQKIAMSFSSGTSQRHFTRDIQSSFMAMPCDGDMFFRIEHTARTWGADIEALLGNHLQNLRKQVSPIKTFIRGHSGKVAFGVGTAFFVTALTVSFAVTGSFASARIAEMSAMLESLEVEGQVAVTAQLKIIADFIAAGAWARYYLGLLVFVVGALILSVIFTVWVDSAGSKQEPSFVLLTRRSFLNKEAALRKLNRTWLSFGLGLIASVVTGVLANLVFAWMFLS